MTSIIFPLICLFLTKFFIQPTTCIASANIQDFEFIDITLLWDQFPSIVDKIKETVTRLRCPKGWKRLGGSCYYLSNLTSISTDANYTCNQIHSNLSNLMQIRNAVELFYATHVLLRNNFTSLMIDIDPSLLKGQKLADMLTNDQDRWNRMKQQLRRVRIKYQNSTKKIIDRLNSAGLRIMRRSRKKQQSFKQYQSNDSIIIISKNVTNSNDEYEYDDLDSPDESDEFEQIEDVRGICNQIHWNVFNNNSNVFILTTYIVSDKIACSLSDVEPNTKYHHACEYVLDYCFANIVCGKYGHCVNTLSGFRCSCSFLFGGLLCDRFSQEGREIVIGIAIILSFYGILFTPVRRFFLDIIKLLIRVCKKCQTLRKQKNEDSEEMLNQDDNHNNDQIQLITIPNQQQPHNAVLKNIQVPNPSSSPIKRNLVRTIWVGILVISFLSILLIMITARYWILFNTDAANDAHINFSANNTKLVVLINTTIHLVRECKSISDHRRENLMFVPFAIILILMFCFLIKRRKRCLHICHSRPGLLPPIEPFRIGNRFPTATIFGILAYEVLKIFEELLFGSDHVSNYGVLFELLIRIATVLISGLRYYPILASLQLSNIVARFFASLYMTFDIIYTIKREGSCMGFLPLSEKYAVVEEAKLRMELGTWFLIYGLIKNIPHFFFLSFVAAELWVRLIYDSIYVQIKKKKSIWSTPHEQLAEAELSKYYVTKLLRRNHRSTQSTAQQNTDNDRSNDEDEAEQEEKANQSKIRKFTDYIYHWNNDFRFTTMVLCTYTVAFVFLYYLTCTFIFLNISRTTGHISFLKSYIESFAKVELKETFSLKHEIILSALATFILFGLQLINGMQNYKKHKIELYRGIYRDIPSVANFKPSTIASNSVHYSGFLVGYMAWGYVICFHVILVIFTGIRSITSQIRHVEVALAFIVPVLVIYLLKMASVKSAGKFLFIRKLDKNLNLKNPRTYAVFVYFIFFADCFLGIASCIIRLIKATILNIVYMARLDYSFLGQPLAQHDVGFAAYVSYLHMEIKQTHPITTAFCYSLANAKHRWPRKYYDEECCTVSSDLDDDDGSEEQRKNEFRQNETNLVFNTGRQQNTNDESIQNIIHEAHELQSRIKYTPLHLQKNYSSSISIYPSKFTQGKYNSVDDEADLLIEETMAEIKAQNPSTATEKDSKMTDDKTSTQQISNISNNAVQVNKNIDSSKPLIPSTTRQQPQLSKPPTNQTLQSKQNQSDDESDEDGGFKRKSTPTNAKVPPQKQQQPPLKTPTQSSKINTDIQIDEDDEDDDGGVNMKKIIKQKREAEEKKKKKDELKKKKQAIAVQDLLDEDEDEDGGTPKQKPKIKPTKTKKKSLWPLCIHNQNEDEDRSLSNQKVLAPEKKEPTSEAKQDKSEQNTTKDNDVNSVLKRQESLKQKKGKKDISKSNILQDEDEDEDGGLIVKTYDSIKMIIPSKQPILDNRTTKQKILSDSTDDDGTLQPSKHKQETTSASYDTINKLVLKVPDGIRNPKAKKTKDRHKKNSIPVEEKISSPVATINSSPSKSSTSRPKKLTLLRRTSYCEAQEHSPPPLSQQPNTSSLLSNQSIVIDDDNSHYSEITHVNKIQTGFINRLYSIIGSLQSLSNYSSKPLPVQTLTANQHAIDIDAKINEERERRKRRKIARNRWFLAYTMIHNPHLFDLRKDAVNRIIFIRSQQSVPNNELEFTGVDADQQPVNIIGVAAPKALKMQRIPEDTATSVESQPPKFLRLFSAPNVDEYQQSSVERYIATRCQMLYDANKEQPTTFRSLSLPQGAPTKNTLQQDSTKPQLCHSKSTSNQSACDYRFSGISSAAQSSALCTQKTHDQFMKDWYEKKSRKFHKKQRHSYIYGPPPQPTLPDKISNAAILTPGLLPEHIKNHPLINMQVNKNQLRNPADK